MNIGGELCEGAGDYVLTMLVENHLISPALGRSKLGGAIISKDKTISVMFNEEDHLREQCILEGFRLKEAYQRLLEVDVALHDKLDIAYKKGLGHLTACPTNLGAGMRASVMMFLPALDLSGELRRLIKKYAGEDVTIRGVYGEGTEAKGFSYQSKTGNLGEKGRRYRRSDYEGLRHFAVCKSARLGRIYDKYRQRQVGSGIRTA